ncbi:MAG: hypothetical protein WBB65_00945 [Anaerolineales bacterium]
MNKFTKRKTLIGAIYVICVLLLGLTLANDFGQTWDDAAEAFYGKEVADAYHVSMDYFRGAIYGKEVVDAYLGSMEYFRYENLSVNGSAYYLFSYWITRGLKGALPSWSDVHLRYLGNFFFFQISVLSIYSISRRLFPRSIAAFISLLYFTQPLLFGHAFINHKDGPFLSMFALAISLGLAMADRFTTSQVRSSPADDIQYALQRNSFIQLSVTLRTNWERSSIKQKVSIATLFLITAALLMDLFQTHLIMRLAAMVVEDAYFDQSLTLIDRAFDLFAQNQSLTSVQEYVLKTQRIINRFTLLALAASGFTLLHLGWRIIGRRKFNVFGGRHWLFLASAAAVGLATAIRIAGPIAGLITSFYLIIKYRTWKTFLLLIPYWGIAGFVTYIFWPALWSNPLSTFMELVSGTANFATIDVLFLGRVFSSNALPWSYFPLLTIYESTIPLLLLVVIGSLAVSSAFRSMQRDEKRILFVLCFWFGIPLTMNIFLHFPNYGNARHYLFSLPPLFILAGYSFQWIFHKIKNRAVVITLTLLVIFPGVWSIAKLHPYEYIYFNNLAGGIPGAWRKFDLDYWCISYKEAIEYLNDTAPFASRVVVWGPIQSARTFAREDLILLDDSDKVAYPEYTLACDRLLFSEDFFPSFNVLHQVNESGAILSEIKVAPDLIK